MIINAKKSLLEPLVLGTSSGAKAPIVLLPGKSLEVPDEMIQSPIVRSAIAKGFVAITNFCGLIIGEGVSKITVSTVQPTNPKIGDLWVDIHVEQESYYIEYSITFNSLPVTAYDAWWGTTYTRYQDIITVVAALASTDIEFEAYSKTWTDWPLEDTSPNVTSGTFPIISTPTDGLLLYKLYCATEVQLIPNIEDPPGVDSDIVLDIRVKTMAGDTVATFNSHWTMDNEYVGPENPTPIMVKWDVNTQTLSVW